MGPLQNLKLLTWDHHQLPHKLLLQLNWGGWQEPIEDPCKTRDKLTMWGWQTGSVWKNMTWLHCSRDQEAFTLAYSGSIESEHNFCACKRTRLVHTLWSTREVVAVIPGSLRLVASQRNFRHSFIHVSQVFPICLPANCLSWQSVTTVAHTTVL